MQLGDRGSALVEAALIVPVMMAVIVGGIDMAIAGIVAQQLSAVTINASFCASQKAPQCPDGSHTAQWAGNQAGIGQQNFVVDWSAAATTGVKVTLNYPYQLLFLPMTVPFTFVSVSPPCHACTY